MVHKAGGGTETYSSQYTYVSTGMAVVSSVSPSTVSVGGLSTSIFIFYVYLHVTCIKILYILHCFIYL